MTERRDLKRRVRDRQLATGESYMTALRHILAQRESTVPVVELLDISDLAAPLGIKCAVKIMPDLASLIDPSALLVQLRDALINTASDRDLAVMRAVVLDGERLDPDAVPPFADGYQFITRLRSGLAGISKCGRTMALSLAGRNGLELVVFIPWLTPLGYFDRPATLVALSATAMLSSNTWGLP